MPSPARRKGTARASKGTEPDHHLNAPDGAVLTDPPEKGLWLALVDRNGRRVTQDGKYVRVD